MVILGTLCFMYLMKPAKPYEAKTEPEFYQANTRPSSVQPKTTVTKSIHSVKISTPAPKSSSYRNNDDYVLPYMGVFSAYDGGHHHHDHGNSCDFGGFDSGSCDCGGGCD